MNKLISNGGDCRTALATPGLLKSNPTPSRFYIICDKCESEMLKKIFKDHFTRVHGENIHPKERGMTLLDSQNG